MRIPPITRKFKITAQAYIKARDFAQKVATAEQQAEIEALAEKVYNYAPEFSEFGNGRILDYSDTDLMTDEDFDQFCQVVHTKMVERGLKDAAVSYELHAKGIANKAQLQTAVEMLEAGQYFYSQTGLTVDMLKKNVANLLEVANLTAEFVTQ